jgi:histidinol-phosphate aminotransferase
MILPKAPDRSWLDSYLGDSLRKSPGYHIAVEKDVAKLDQNEIPLDWPLEIKDLVLAGVRATPWNRYPPSYQKELEDILALRFGFAPGSILLAPGSNHLLAVVIETLCLAHKRDIWVLSPSFPLYEERLAYRERPYRTWPLTEDLEFDPRGLSQMTPGSLVLFASPNNPTGAFLPKKDLDLLLRTHPKSYFVADEAYFEFAPEDYSELLAEHPNLMLVRTLSKTSAGAGLRLGYLVGALDLVKEIRKTMLPFMINPFTFEAAKVALTNPDFERFLRGAIASTKTERTLQFERLQMGSPSGGYRVYPGHGNFFLVRWTSDTAKEEAYQRLKTHGYLVRDVGRNPGLRGCLRISLGTEKENLGVMEAMN